MLGLQAFLNNITSHRDVVDRLVHTHTKYQQFTCKMRVEVFFGGGGVTHKKEIRGNKLKIQNSQKRYFVMIMSCLFQYPSLTSESRKTSLSKYPEEIMFISVSYKISRYSAKLMFRSPSMF